MEGGQAASGRGDVCQTKNATKDISSSSKKDDLMVEKLHYDDGLSGVEQDEDSFLSCQIADQSLGSSRHKSDSESASYVSCLSKTDAEKASFLTRDGTSGNVQPTSGQSNDGKTEVVRVERHASLISDPLGIEETNVSQQNSGVLSCKTNNQTLDGSHKNVSESIDGEKEQFNRNCNTSVYDNVNISDSQSCGSLLSVPNQRSVTGHNARCLAPRRNRTGQRCSDRPNATSRGDANGGDFNEIDADTGLPYIVVTKYSQSPCSGDDDMNYRTPMSHHGGKVHFRHEHAAATPFRTKEQHNDDSGLLAPVKASTPRRVSLKLPTPRLAIKFTPVSRRRDFTQEITPYVPSRQDSKETRHDTPEKSLADTAASTGTWRRFSVWSPWNSTNRMQYAGLFETSFVRRLRPSVPNSEHVSVSECQENKMDRPKTTAILTNENCQIQGKAKALGVACVIFTYFILGLCHTLLGQTLIDIEEKIGITLNTSAFLFTCRDTGTIIGAMLVGVVFRRYRWFLSYGCALTLCAVVTTIVPLATSLIQMTAAVLAQGVLLGFLDCGSNAQCLRLRGSGGVPFIDCMHVANIIGCVLAPILARPFLTAGSPAYTPLGFRGHDAIDVGSIDITNSSAYNKTSGAIHSVAFSNTTNPGDVAADSGEGFRFENAYFIAASLLLAAGVAAIALSLTARRGDVTERSDVTDKTKRQRRPADVSVRVACLYAIFQCVQVGVETTYGCLLVSYAVKGVGWSKASAGMVAVVYFGSCAVGRAVCLTVVSKASATISIFCGFATVLTSLLLLLLYGRTYLNIVWLTAAMQGVASSVVLPACIIWIGRDVALTVRMTRVRFVASCVGMVTAPGIVGYCMRAQRPDTFASMLFGACIVNMLVFAILRGTFRRRKSHPAVDQNNKDIGDKRNITNMKEVA